MDSHGGTQLTPTAQDVREATSRAEEIADTIVTLVNNPNRVKEFQGKMEELGVILSPLGDVGSLIEGSLMVGVVEHIFELLTHNEAN